MIGSTIGLGIFVWGLLLFKKKWRKVQQFPFYSQIQSKQKFIALIAYHPVFYHILVCGYETYIHTASPLFQNYFGVTSYAMYKLWKYYSGNLVKKFWKFGVDDEFLVDLLWTWTWILYIPNLFFKIPCGRIWKPIQK